jgi:hypothetical protein
MPVRSFPAVQWKTAGTFPTPASCVMIEVNVSVRSARLST